MSKTENKHPLRGTWVAMRSRCYNVRSKDFSYYGGRGIDICQRWMRGENGMSGFACFVADMGPKPSPEHSIDRINNDGHYEPGNCRWATSSQQRLNQRAKVICPAFKACKKAIKNAKLEDEALRIAREVRI